MDSKAIIVFFASISAAMMLAAPANASYISMTMTFSAPNIIDSDSFSVNVTLVNKGDEPAYDVSVGLNLPQGFDHEHVFVGTCHPNVEYPVSFKVKADESLALGTYPGIVKLHYADANSYPFSNVGPMFIRYRAAAPTKIRGSIDAANISSDGSPSKLRLRLSNLDQDKRSIDISLHLPNEVRAKETSKTVLLGPKTESLVEFEVENFGALPGSRYSVVAGLSFEGDMHHGSFAQGIIEIRDDIESEKDFLPAWLPAASLIALFFAFLLYQFIGPIIAGKKDRQAKTRERNPR